MDSWKVIGNYEPVSTPGGVVFEPDTHEWAMDIVFYGDNFTPAEIYRDLTGHDGYPIDIRLENGKGTVRYDPDTKTEYYDTDWREWRHEDEMCQCEPGYSCPYCN